jgi:hypothetical protein
MAHVARKATGVATVHDDAKKSGRVLPHHSAIFHAYAQTLSRCTPAKRGKVSNNSFTHEAIKFDDSTCLVCVCTFKCLFIWTQPTRALTDAGESYHLGALNFISDNFASFPSSILPFPLIAPPSLQLCQYLDHLAKPHRTSIDRKSSIASGFQPHDFYRCLYN